MSGDPLSEYSHFSPITGELLGFDPAWHNCTSAPAEWIEHRDRVFARAIARGFIA